ncbi:MAG: hypothetical protein R3F59_33290 [Myxococcota bacterium]
MLWLWAAALAAPAEPVEDIVVWGDRFQRWERRWLVQTEVVLPEPLVLLAERNREVALQAVQVRAVFDCDKDFPQGRRSWEVHCTIEDIGLIGLAPAPGRGAAQVLAETDAALSGARVQLQVTEDGGVPDVDLEGLTAADDRGRRRVEAMRQLMSRVVLPFQLRLPDTIRDGAAWYEPAPRLMSMPSGTGSGGSSTVAHRMDLVGDKFVVQSIGEGTVKATVGVEALAPLANSDNGNGPLIDVIDLATPTWALRLDGVAVVDRDTGIMSERVWAVRGEPTATVASRGPYAHTGRLELLGEHDAPDVGPTKLAALGEWVPLSW